MITQEMIDLIYSKFDESFEAHWVDAFDNVVEYCDKWTNGDELTDFEIGEIEICYEVISEWE